MTNSTSSPHSLPVSALDPETMACYSVLRIGPIDSEKGYGSQLQAAIASHFKASSANDTSTSELFVSNRYFDANVMLTGLHESTADNIEDGIILVFDSSSDASSSEKAFDSLTTVHNSAERLDRAGELLRLCVGVSFGPSPLSDGSKKSEEEYSRRVLWCLDRGYEYVEADLTEEGMAKGHEDRDKEGYARIVEAISSCMWSSHVMKKRSVVAAPVTKKVDKSEDEVGKESKEIGGNSIQSQSSDHDTREAAAMSTLMKGVEEESESTSDESKHEQKRQEIAFHELEHVMTEAKRIREASQSESMTDEERRQRAGDTAMRLMGLLDKLGFDDDEEDSSNEEDAA